MQMIFKLRMIRRLVRILPWRGGGSWRGARNEEFEKLRRTIEGVENRRNGDAKVNLEEKEEIEDEENIGEVDPMVCLISFLSNIGSARVKKFYYDDRLRDETLIDWIG